MAKTAAFSIKIINYVYAPMHKYRFVSTLILLLTCCLTRVWSQCMMTEVSLTDRYSEATCIVEGRITGYSCSWDVLHKNIYTTYSLEVSKIFKGDVTGDVEIVSIGGTVDEISEWVGYG